MSYLKNMRPFVQANTLCLISHNRKFITTDSCGKLVHSFVTFKLHYCNSLLVYQPNCDINKLQKVQNVAARIVIRNKFSDAITPLLLSLHWLPIPRWTVCKLMLLTYKCLNGEGPLYLKDFYPSITQRTQASEPTLLQPRRFRLDSYGEKGVFSCCSFLLE